MRELLVTIWATNLILATIVAGIWAAIYRRQRERSALALAGLNALAAGLWGWLLADAW